MERRIKGALALITVCFIALGLIASRCILFYDEQNLQSLSGQYYRVVDTVYPRGTIFDKNGIAFNMSAGETFDYLLMVDTSYPAVAPQVIGVVQTDPYDTTSDSCRGLSGINYIFDELLNGGSPINVNATVDANSNVLTEFDAIIVGDHINEGCDISLTLDYNLQKEFEGIMADFAEKNSHESLCAMLTDSATGEITVMATHGSEMNMNMLSFQPGSVMKIIAAACALEEGLISPDEKFICTGTFSVGEDKRSCSGDIVHGEITMQEAFGSSCNHWAYEVNKMLVYGNDKENMPFKSKMLDMAKNWGFSYYGEEVSEFILSYDGHYSFIPKSLHNDMDIFNSALGQGNIQSSVYLINKITSAIANGGECVRPYIVSSIIDPAQNVIYDCENDKEYFNLGLTDSTVFSLQSFMRQSCITGSARSIGVEGAAGKTGTSENIEGKECHSWFTGYFPVGGRNYALTVFVENGGNAPQSAVPLFDSLAQCVVGIVGE